MRSLAQAALDHGASNPATALALLNNISGSLQKDQNLELSDIKGLINAFRDLDPQSIEMLTVPIVGAKRGSADVVILQQPDADAILNRLRTFNDLPTGLPTLVPPSEVRIRVLNGSGASGRAKEVQDALAAHGFVTAGPPADADRSDYAATEIRWAAGAAGKALTAASFLGGARAVQARPGEVKNADLVIIVGKDWDTLVARAKIPPDASATTSPAPASSSAPVATTTTTVTSPAATAVVPVDPKTGGPLVGCP
jgi:hypothetical protein